MIVNVYSIRDNKVNGYMQPFFSQTHGSAIRAFADHCLDDKSMPHKHPEDFDLYFVGGFDDTTGLMQPVQSPQLLAGAKEYVRDDS